MQAGDYGTIESSMLEKYRQECHRLWPQANIFQPNPPMNIEQSQSPPPSYSSATSPPPPYSSNDILSNGGSSGTS